MRMDAMEPLLKSSPAGDAAWVKDSSTAQFKADVIDASMDVPVIVDFWATWCGPCKTLGPTLEKLVLAARGKLRLVKIDIDQNQALSAQLRIQSVPTVYAFHRGRPVDGFTGALPESQVKAFLDKVTQLAGGNDGHLDALLAEAKAALDGGDTEGAAGIYNHVLEHDPEEPAALAGIARCLMAAGQSAEATKFLDELSADLRKNAEIAAVRTALDLQSQSAEAVAALPALEARLAANVDDHEARFDLAMAHFGAGRPDAAVDALLEIFRRDRDWNEQAARKQLVKFFEAFGPTDPLTLSGRRRLSSLMFS
jgi:putative thioredoxin